MELPEELRKLFAAPTKRVDKDQQKHVNSIQYRRRLLDKDIKQLLNKKGPIRFRSILKIHRKHNIECYG